MEATTTRAVGQSRGPSSTRLAVLVVASCLVGAASGAAQPEGVLPGANVNMVSGTTWPDGDPFLQRQNEPSIAVSTRNPLHLMAGANDYRTVDLPGLPDGKETGDSWLGAFESGDGGGSWRSTLLACYPQADPGACAGSPIFGFEAAADPVVRAGTHGLFFYSGIVFDRGFPAPSAAFVARFMDLNNDTADPVQYIDTVLVDSNLGDAFIDKPWLETDIPRSGAQTVTLSVPQGAETVSQTVECGNVYMAWASITGEGAALRTEIMFSRSTDCGGTWSTPIPLSPPDTVGQGATIAVAPPSGRVYVAWRQFHLATLDCVPGAGFWKNQPDAWPVGSIVMGGVTYTKAQALAILDVQPMGDATYILAYQLIPAKLSVLAGAEDSVIEDVIADADAWLQAHPLGSRPSQPIKDQGLALKDQLEAFNLLGTSDTGPCAAAVTGSPDAILVAHSDDGGQSFSTPVQVAELLPFDQGTSVYSFRTNAYPTMAVDGSGRAYLAWVTRGLAIPNVDPVSGDSRTVVATSNDGATWTAPQPIDQPEDEGHQLFPSLTFNAGQLVMVYNDYRLDASGVFERFVVDLLSTERPLRHTVDIRAAVADPADIPVFTDYTSLPSSQVSRYPFVVTGTEEDPESQQLQFNPPNLPMFELGTKPFFADYLDVTGAPRYLSNPDGSWSHNTAASSAPVFHATWTDNRDVVGPPDGDWTSYIPPGLGGTSVFDSTSTVPSCDPLADFDRTQMRNQNIYTSRLTRGLYVAVPSNARPLSAEFQRAFVLFVQNATAVARDFELTILSQPPGGAASFEQFAHFPQLITPIGAFSSVSQTVFVTSSDPAASVDVRVREVGACEVSGTCLESVVRINPDSSNPPPADPTLAAGEFYNPAVLNPAVYNPAVYNPAVLNPAVLNFDPSNPAVLNFDVENPAVYNPAVLNPAVYNPAVYNTVFNLAMTTLALLNPAVLNPAVLNPAVLNPAVLNPAVLNPAVLNPAVLNPAVFNPAVLNPAVLNPAVLNPAVYNTTVSDNSITDANFVAQNTGNATMAYSFNVRVEGAPSGYVYQLMIYRLYFTPVANGCKLAEAAQHELLVNDLDPDLGANLLDPNGGASFYLNPGDLAVATLRIIPDPDAPADPGSFDVGDLSVSVVSKGVDTDDAAGGETRPDADVITGSSLTPLSITTAALPPGFVGSPYAVTLTADGGSGPRLWSVAPGSAPPPGLTLSVSGDLTGVPTADGSYPVTIRVTDETGLDERTFTVDVSSAPAFLTFAYEGTVDTTLGGPAFDAFLGETIRFEYTFDTSTPDSNPSGNGDYINALTDVVVSVGANSYTAALGDIVVTNSGTNPDRYVVDAPSSSSGPSIDGIPIDRLILLLVDSTQTYFSTDALPLVQPDPSGFDNVQIRIEFDSGTQSGSLMANTVSISGLGFVLQPGDSTAGQPIGPVSVELRDVSGAVLPGVGITMAVGATPCPGASIGGVVTATTDGVGVATFGTLSVDKGGSGYTLVASVTGSPGISATSQPFDVMGFCDTGSLSTARGELPGVLLPGGTVLFPGGTIAAGVVTETAELFDPAGNGGTGSFVPTGSMGTARGRHAAVRLADGRVLVAGGVDNAAAILTSAEVFDPAGDGGDGSFSGTDDMAVPRIFLTTTLLPNGQVLVAGGTTSFAAAELFDPAGNGGLGTFSLTGDMNIPRKEHTSTLLPDGRVLLAGGTAAGALASAELYDPATGSFTVAPGAMGTARYAAAATLLPDGRVLIAGGRGVSGYLASAELFDPSTGTFTSTAGDLGMARAWHASTLLADGTVLITGGTGSGGFLASAERFDPLTGRFSPAGDMRAGRRNHPAVRLPDDRVLVGGGVGDAEGGILLAGAELFLSLPPSTFIVTTTADAGAGSLRQALLDANANPGRDRIVFDIPGPGPHTISPGSPLPWMTDPVVLDATTQPGFAGPPLIEIDGSSAGAGAASIVVTGGNSVVRGLAINRFQDFGIRLAMRGFNVVEGNYIGTDPTGTVALGNTVGGVRVGAAPNNRIGGTTTAARNVISGNSQDGLELQNSHGTVVQGNFVGTDASGTTALGNSQTGINVSNGSANTLIGGTQPGAGNVISGNTTGVSITFAPTTRTRVVGNLIGTDVSGSVDLGNYWGIYTSLGASHTLIGGTGPAARNVISGNNSAGIALSGSSDNVIQGNLIGTDASGTLALGNGAFGGVVFFGDDSVGNSNNVVGGPEPGAGNVIAFNGGHGIRMYPPTSGVDVSAGNSFQGNSIHSNAGLGIDLPPDGVNANDPGDADAGANTLLNAPVVTVAGTPLGGVTQVYFGIDTQPNTALTVELFHNPTCDVSGSGEGETPFGRWALDSGPTGVAGNVFYSSAPIPPDSWVTATATDAAGNTSEFSQCVQEGPGVACSPGCAGAPDFYPCANCAGSCTGFLGVCIGGTCTVAGVPQICP
jgi:parallel beta-helix repeat protein